MKKFFIATVVVIIGLAGAWYNLAPDSKEKAALFFGLASLPDASSAKSLIASKITPASPQEKRALLLKELNKNLSTLKQSALFKNASGAPPSKEKSAAAENIAALIGSSENIVKQIEQADKSSPDRSSVIGRIINVFSPGVGNTQCAAP